MRSDHNFQLNNIQNSLEELHKPFPEIKGLHKLKVSDPDAENSSLQENNLPPFGQVLMVEKAYGDGEVGARITYLLLTCLLLVVFSIISSVSKSELCDVMKVLTLDYDRYGYHYKFDIQLFGYKVDSRDDWSIDSFITF